MKRLLAIFLLAFLINPITLRAETMYRGMTLGDNVAVKDIKDLAATLPGINVVRYLFIMRDADTASQSEWEAWLAEEIAHLDALLPTFNQHGIKLYLNLYSPPGGFYSQEAPAYHRLFAEAWTQQALLAAWQTIASHYNGNTDIIAYDLVNEPAEREVAAGLKDWPTLAADLITVIRSVEPDRKIVLQPKYGNSVYLRTIKMFDKDNIIYSFHNYYPSKFIKQGLEGRKTGIKYPKKRLNRGKLRRALKKATRFYRRLKKSKRRAGNLADARMYVGEFSCVRWAPEGSAVKYFRDLTKIFESRIRGWDWTMHAWRDDNVWSVEHGSDINNNDPSPTVTDRAQFLIDAFAKN